jgi:hypothetical protein
MIAGVGSRWAPKTDLPADSHQLRTHRLMMMGSILQQPPVVKETACNSAISY